MSREIKFRGLRTDGKGWVIGGVVYGKSGNVYIFQGNDIEIVEDDCLEVIPETVGQFICLKDKNGKEIYEGDILACEYWDGCEHVVEYEQDSRHIGYWFPKDDNEEIEIIGNIHEKGENK